MLSSLCSSEGFPQSCDIALQYISLWPVHTFLHLLADCFIGFLFVLVCCLFVFLIPRDLSLFACLLLFFAAVCLLYALFLINVVLFICLFVWFLFKLSPLVSHQVYDTGLVDCEMLRISPTVSVIGAFRVICRCSCLLPH